MRRAQSMRCRRFPASDSSPLNSTRWAARSMSYPARCSALRGRLSRQPRTAAVGSDLRLALLAALAPKLLRQPSAA
eukprot:15463336-Alexandrium_andersonii.AAC.1